MTNKMRQAITAGAIVIFTILVVLFSSISKSEYYETPKGEFKSSCWEVCLNGSEQTKQSRLCQYVFESKVSLDEDVQFAVIRWKIESEYPKAYKQLEFYFGDLY